jgi:hypothetical protein
MSVHELNLGPFNCCVEYIPSKCENLKFSEIGSKNTVVFYTKNDGTVEAIVKADGYTIIPTFELGLSIDIGDTSHIDKKLSELTRAFELKIITDIYRMLQKCEAQLDLDNIVIPIKRKLEIHLQNNILYGSMELGLAMLAEDTIAKNVKTKEILS